jgi:hypothetical protein
MAMVDTTNQPNFAGAGAANSLRDSFEVAIPHEDRHALNFKTAARVPHDRRLKGGDVGNLLCVPCLACCSKQPIEWDILGPALGIWLCVVTIVAGIYVLPGISINSL